MSSGVSRPDITIPEEARQMAYEICVAPWENIDATLAAAAPLIVAAALRDLRSANTEHLRYEHDYAYDKRTEIEEADFVPAEAIDDLIEACERAAELRGGAQ